MRRAALLLVALLVAVQAEGASLVEDEYEKALLDEALKTECVDCPRCPPPPADCTFLVSSGMNHFYNVDDVKLKINSWRWHVTLTCLPGLKLESASLPAFPTPMRVLGVELIGCPAPRVIGGISRVLSRLNITGFLELYLTDVPPTPTPRLQPDLFSGLQDLYMLDLSAEPGQVLESPPEVLEPLMKLKILHLTDVRISPATLDRLLEHLEELHLVQLLPAEGSAPALPSTDLENVTLTVARSSCSSLRRLRVSSPRGTAALPMPAGWLQVQGEARCPRLNELKLYSCALGGLPADALRGLTELRELAVKDCRELRALPRKLFDHTRSLRYLNLTNNALEVLPEGIFSPLGELEELDLSGNRLGALGDGAAVLRRVGTLTSLQVLLLDRNPLSDTCGHLSCGATFTACEVSPLRELRRLRILSLAHTGASRLCEDWRRDLHALHRINFSHNNVTMLKYSDMQWYGRDCEVNLEGNPLRDVIVTSEDYVDAHYDKPLMVRTVLKFNADLVSSCRVYWAARALREGLLRAKLVGLKCAGRPLEVAPLDDMTCAETEACPERCTCTLRPPDYTLVLRCAARRDLPYMARVAGDVPRLEVSLAGVHLASLPDALSARLRVLDLRNAWLPAATERQAAALFADGRDVLLDGARVACACAGGARPALVRVLAGRVPDVRCAEDGRRASEVPPCPVAAEPEPHRSA